MAADVDSWCVRHLGSPVTDTLSEAGHLSRVTCVRLADGREVTVKVRPYSLRLIACTEVQRALWRKGFPAPEPLSGPIVDDGWAISAEAYHPGGTLSPSTAPAGRFAELLARFIGSAPPPSAVGTLEPTLPWVAWGHAGNGLWPVPDDRDADLNAPEHATPWLDEIGARVKRRLRRVPESDGAALVVGHGDWEAQNLRWDGDEPLVVHDWDSVMTAPEAAIVGLAASVWPCGIAPRAATVGESAEFLDEYQRAAGRLFTADEIEVSWAAGLWVYAFNTKKASLDGVPWLSPDEADERLRLAGA